MVPSSTTPKDRFSVRTRLYSVIVLLAVTSTSVAQNDSTRDEEPTTQTLALFGYDHLSLDDLAIRSPSLGLAIIQPDRNVVGLYTRHQVTGAEAPEYSDTYHSLDLMLEAQRERHHYLGIFNSTSDQPVRGGLSTYMAGAFYGYEFIESDRFSLIAGGGLAIGDFGITTRSGDVWPIIPLPILRLHYRSPLLSATTDIIGSPAFSAVLGPNHHWRLITEARVSELNSARDVIFDLSANYRFFLEDHPYGDFAGIALGVKNDGYAFQLSEDKGTYEVDYLAGYARVDLSFLTLTGGYVVSGREHLNDAEPVTRDDGYFVSLQGMYQF